MKTIILIIIIVACSFTIFGAEYKISINGTSYSPNSITIKVGDKVIISASSMHPLVQVSESTWNSNETDEFPGGWGTQTSNYTFIAAVESKIFFVCSSHIGLGMKGQIIVEPATTGLEKLNNPENLLLYPNPAKSYIYVAFPSTLYDNFNFNVYNMKGQLVKSISHLIVSETNNSPFVFEIDELKNGVYFLQLNNRNKKFYSKFTVIK